MIPRARPAHQVRYPVRRQGVHHEAARKDREGSLGIRPQEGSRGFYGSIADGRSHRRPVQSRDGRGREDPAGRGDEGSGLTGRSVQRYIKLTELTPERLEMVDNKKLSLVNGVDIVSFDKEVQECLLTYIQVKRWYISGSTHSTKESAKSGEPYIIYCHDEYDRSYGIKA